MRLRRYVRPLGAALAVTAVMGATAGPAAAAVPVAFAITAGPGSPIGSAAFPVRSWHPLRAASVRASAASVLRTAPARGRVRVVSVVDDAGKPRVQVRTAADKSAATAAVSAAQAVPGVVAVAVDVRRSAAGLPPSPSLADGTAHTRPDDGARRRAAAALTPANDSSRPLQWALDRLRAEATWQVHDAAGVTVAVVDTGVAHHPDLDPVVLPGADCYATDVCVTTTGAQGRHDGEGHGTHVAGIIAAVSGNGIGVAGLARHARILPVKVLDDEGSGWDSSIANGIVWAVDHGASVINLSLGGDQQDPVLDTAVAYAAAHNVAVLAAAGNSGEPCTTTVTTECGNPQVSYPAQSPGATSVGATDVVGGQDVRAFFSQHGPWLDLAAPGVDIFSTFSPLGCAKYTYADFNGDGLPDCALTGLEYAYESGTSMATPYAAATVALVRATAPQLTAAQAVALVERTADDAGAAGRDDEFGYGVVDPLAAVTAARATVPVRPTALTLSAPTKTLAYGATARLAVALTASGHGVAGQRVVLTGTPGDGSPRRTVILTTAATGTAAVTVRASATTVWSARFGGAIGLKASETTARTVRVSTRLEVRVVRHTLRLAVAPAAVRTIVLQLRWKGHWERVGSLAVLHPTAVFTGVSRGTFRIVVPTTPASVGTTGRPLRVT